MREKILKLEHVARQLEPSTHARRELTARAVAYADRFLDELPTAPVYVSGEPSPSFGADFDEAPADFEALLGELAVEVDTLGINPASGAHLGYIPGGGVYFSALGDYLADVTNRYSGIWFASPGAAQLERRLIQWIAAMIGYDQRAGGDLTSGGSIANLSAIVAAREAHEIGAADISQTCIYYTSQVHHCVTKALAVAGLRECRQRIVPMDRVYRMDVGALQTIIAGDTADGLKPWLIIGSAGTTDTGSIDPLGKLADIATQHGLWFHVDAAYGGCFLMCAEGKQRLMGIERADSIVMDPHKGLFLPYGSGAVVLRDADKLAAAYRYEANYMQDATEAEIPSPASLSPELTRPFRGLRLWFALKLAGLAPFRAALAEKMALARYFHARIGEMPRFEVGPAPELSVVIYRYLPRYGDADEFNLRLVDAIQRDGQIFISSTRIDGQVMLRLAVLNFRTHLEHIDKLLELLQIYTVRLDSPAD